MTRHSRAGRSFLALAIWGTFSIAQSLQAFALVIDPELGLDYRPNESIGTSTVQLETGTTGNAGLIGSSSEDSLAKEQFVLDEDETLRVTRDELDSEGGAKVEARAVITKRDLKNFAYSELYDDQNLESLKFTHDSVELRYRESGKFLALMSIPLTVRAKAKANGTTVLDYPWYSLLTVDHESEIETEMRVAVNNAIHSRPKGSVKAAEDPKHPTFSFPEAAQVAEQIHASLKSNL